jgi:hypothetical protein
LDLPVSSTLREYISAHYKFYASQVQWLTPVVLATWQTEFTNIVVQGQCEKKNCETPPISTEKSGCSGMYLSFPWWWEV